MCTGGTCLCRLTINAQLLACMLENARHHYLIVRYELCCDFDTVTIVRYQGYWVSAPEADLETPERQTAGRDFTNLRNIRPHREVGD